MSNSQLLHPLISPEAVSTLSTVAEVPSGRDENAMVAELPSRADSVSRYRQVLLTSIPLVTADLIAIICSYVLGKTAASFLLETRQYSDLMTNMLALCLCHVLVGCMLEIFPASGMNPVRELRNQLTSLSAAFVLLVALNGLLGQVTTDEFVILAVAFPASFLTAPLTRLGARQICAPFSWWGERVIIVGSGQQGLLVYKFLKSQLQRGLKPVGIVDDSAADYWTHNVDPSVEFLGSTTELVSICRKHQCHWVIAATAEKTGKNEVNQIVKQCSLIPNLVVLHSNLMIPSLWVETFDAAGLNGVHIRDSLLFPSKRYTKRLADIMFSSALLVLCLPLYLAVFVWLRSKSKGPVLFKHRRIGRSGRPFHAWKFRTMVTDAEDVLRKYLNTDPNAKAEWDEFHKLKNDPRIIPGVGGILRKLSLDELPQLWNVLKGDMSLVGPRPVYTEDEIRMYGDFYQFYLRVRPGLTGLWQVSGRNNTTFADKVHLDTYYAMNWSLWLDYYILLRTVRTLLLREGSC